MYLKIDENKLNKIENLTMTDFGAKLGYITTDSAIDIIDSLLSENDRLQAKIKDIEQDIENNYELKKINLYTEYGLSEKDFI